MIISAAANNHFSPPEWNVVKDVKSDIPIVLVTRLNGYVFNEDLLSLKRYVLVNMCEFNWIFAYPFVKLFPFLSGE